MMVTKYHEKERRGGHYTYRYEIGENNFGFACSQQSRDRQDQVSCRLSELYMMSKHQFVLGHQQQASPRDLSKAD